MTTPKNQPISVPYGSYGRDLESLLHLTLGALRRSGAPPLARHPGAKPLLERLLLITQNTYLSAKYLSAQGPPNPARKREFVLSVPPLSRTILDTLFTVVFLFGNLQRRVQWYYEAGWKQAFLDAQRLRNRYRIEPAWSRVLTELDLFVSERAVQWRIPKRKQQDPSLIQWWPHPGRMVALSDPRSDRKAFLRYMADWYYGFLSQDSHLSYAGLVRRSTMLGLDSEPLSAQDADHQYADIISTLATVTIAFLSELQVELPLGETAKAKYVWTVLGGFWDGPKDIYDRFYANRL